MGKGSKDKRRKKNKRGSAKKKMTNEQSLALKSIKEWVFCCNDEEAEEDDFLPEMVNSGKVVFELHAHSFCSDGYLSPSALVERAHQHGAILALTDHDTMSGIPEALEAAHKLGMKIIPGVEISTVFSTRQIAYMRTANGARIRENSASEEAVHILAYYSSGGPSNYEEFDKFLASIREGRYLRAKNMLSKLKRLKMPLKWEHVARIAGSGVAPGRLHVARALVEAGHVQDLKQAFAWGSEPCAEDAVKMVCKTGGVSVLAHPWTLKTLVPVVKKLKEAGLHGIEVYRSDGKLAVYSDLADAHGLLKLGGSDFHGKGGHGESPLGSVSLPVLAVHDFLSIARPIWCDAIKNILEQYIKEPSELNVQHIFRFGKTRIFDNDSSGIDLIRNSLLSWLTKEEMQHADFEAIMLKLSGILVD
ncbi:hypothetical protein Cgig2_001867 [Carnegiea gigantea]|uniref:Polymerase/histidinol phosphatase N-terminal domain-containing protein n=1 Tax=Carnegiea gigantea TaxID=171969 RepID=A0A9Q1JZX5_9CARY|nr:hypothetical protein Cgig2_001867 [Carnegiea gigantea]